MGFFSKDIKTMDDLFVHMLRDMYYAEKQIVQALPDMIDKASDPQLRQGFQSHLHETENHVRRLERVFQLHGNEPKGVDCPAIDGILEEADEVAAEVADKAVLDAALIAAAQAVEHYEITRYGSLVAWARQASGDIAVNRHAPPQAAPNPAPRAGTDPCAARRPASRRSRRRVSATNPGCPAALVWASLSYQQPPLDLSCPGLTPSALTLELAILQLAASQVSICRSASSLATP